MVGKRAACNHRVLYKITKIVRALWLAERSVCMRVYKQGSVVKMYWLSRANHASKNLKKFSSWKVDKFTLLNHSFVDWNLENLYKQAVGSDGKREKELSRDDLERISSGIVQGIGRNIDWSIVSHGNHPPIITTLILPEIPMLNDGSQSLILEICLQLLSLLSWIPWRD